MFLAIVNETYADVKSTELEDKSYLWMYLAKLFRKSKCCKKKEPVADEESKKSIKHRHHQEKVNQEAIVQNLFKVVELKDTEEFQKLAKRVAVIEGSMENLHERLDALIVQVKRKMKENKGNIV